MLHFEFLLTLYPTLEFKLRKKYSPGTSGQSQLALHFATKCNNNCDWINVAGEYIFLSLNSSSEALEFQIRSLQNVKSLFFFFNLRRLIKVGYQENYHFIFDVAPKVIGQ